MTARARAIVVGAAVTAFLLAVPTSADTGDATSHAHAQAVVLMAARGEVIGGVDIDAAVADLGDDNVTVIGESGATAGLAAAVSESRGDGLGLSVVSVASSLTTQQAMDIAGAVQVQSGGTVIVLAPDAIGSRSNTVSTAADEDARGAAARPPTHPPRFVPTPTWRPRNRSPGPSW